MPVIARATRPLHGGAPNKAARSVCRPPPGAAARRLPALPPSSNPTPPQNNPPHSNIKKLEEDLADDLKWSMMVRNVMFSGKSDFQEVDLIHTAPFGKVTCAFAAAAAAAVCVP